MFTNIIMIAYIALIFIYIISHKKQFINKKMQGLFITLGVLFYLLYIIYYIKTFHTFPHKSTP
jgi:uncharacterized membrane protein (DUF485 family)